MTTKVHLALITIALLCGAASVAVILTHGQRGGGADGAADGAEIIARVEERFDGLEAGEWTESTIDEKYRELEHLMGGMRPLNPNPSGPDPIRDGGFQQGFALGYSVAQQHSTDAVAQLRSDMDDLKTVLDTQQTNAAASDVPWLGIIGVIIALLAMLPSWIDLLRRGKAAA